MNSKAISFVAIMGALGNILFLISNYLGPIAQGVAFDFSLVGVFIAGMYGGPVVGSVTGLIAYTSFGIGVPPFLGTGGGKIASNSSLVKVSTSNNFLAILSNDSRY